MLVRHGYGVLLFDRRGEGESERRLQRVRLGRGRGPAGRDRVPQARPDVDPERIGGLGLSVGGELLLETAAETDDLEAVVADGAGYRSIREQLAAPGAGKWLLLPNYALTTGATAILANQGPPPNLKDLVGAHRAAARLPRLRRPRRRRGGAPEPGVLRCGRRAEDGLGDSQAGHTGGLDARPREYEARVIAFFERALLGLE